MRIIPMELCQEITELLTAFVGRSQALATISFLGGEDGAGYVDTLAELTKVIKAMPLSTGRDRDKVAYLHYFKDGMDYYITAKDSVVEGDTPEQLQSQAYGYACPFAEGEMGYISIRELITHGVELDYHWTPRPLAEVVAERLAA